jgi:acyl-[acyl-carrier-protein]-phospholipid O-acyltransferase / long-chain-fatty-acid--[acyl-carrier-protein] ligase
MSVHPPVTSAPTAEVYTPDRPVPPLPKGWRSLPAAFLVSARANWSKVAIIDSLGTKLTYGETLIRALILGRIFQRKLGPEPYVGVLVPPGAAGAVANLALSMLGKIPVNLNYSASKSVIDASIAQCGIKQILTSPRIIDKIGYQPSAELIYLEDLKDAVNTFDKVWSAAMAKLAPLALLTAVRPGFGSSLDKTATVMFTSGSTGDPKGVVLSHGNILWNVHQMNTQLQLLPEEVVMGILPFFHAFGYTVSIWTVLLLGKLVIYHYSPLDTKIIPDLIQKHGATMLTSSPTFFRNYLERSKPGQLDTLVHILLGSERLKPELAEEIRTKLKKEPMEGYGCTEVSPVVSVNALTDLTTRDGRKIHGGRAGTTGMPLPGTAIKTTDPETGADLPRGTEGVVWVKGPQVMVGYLDRPEATAKVLKDGWYCTGDLGFLDPDGFLKLTGRLSRFAKIGGEMIPLEGVEAALQEATGVGELALAVTTVPDPRRGERLVVLYTDMGMPPEAVYQRLSSGALPKLWLPATRDFVQVDEIPCLGVGKRDLRKLKELAAEKLPG